MEISIALVSKIGYPLTDILYNKNILIVSKLALFFIAINILAEKNITKLLDIKYLLDWDIKRLEFNKRYKKSEDSHLE